MIIKKGADEKILNIIPVDSEDLDLETSRAIKEAKEQIQKSSTKNSNKLESN